MCRTIGDAWDCCCVNASVIATFALYLQHYVLLAQVMASTHLAEDGGPQPQSPSKGTAHLSELCAALDVHIPAELSLHDEFDRTARNFGMVATSFAQLDEWMHKLALIPNHHKSSGIFACFGAKLIRWLQRPQGNQQGARTQGRRIPSLWQPLLISLLGPTPSRLSSLLK